MKKVKILGNNFKNSELWDVVQIQIPDRRLSEKPLQIEQELIAVVHESIVVNHRNYLWSLCR
jgi:hypothetical protein